jgi:putative toxin-antitoxin system antitoxin component (TIGR02293 family)
MAELRQYTEISEILGSGYVNEPIHSSYDYISLAGSGLNANVIRNFARHFQLRLSEISKMLNVSEPTIYRWSKSGRPLDKYVAIKLLEITELFLSGMELFGDRESFFKWLSLPNTSLGGMEPQELLQYPDGISKVRDALGRIEYGILG